MEAWLADPRVQSTVAPFAVAAVVAGLARAAGGGRGEAWAALAVIAGFAAAYLLILGTPPLPPRSSAHKVAYLGVGAAALGLALDLVRARPLLVWVATAVGAGTAALWLLGGRLDLNDPMTLLWPALPLVAAWLVVTFRLESQRADGLTAPVVIMVAAAALALVALLGRSASIAQLAAALAAAVAGLAVWNWPVARIAGGRAATFAGGTVLVALATQSMLFTEAEAAALAVLLLVPFADRPAGWLLARLVAPGGRIGQALAPLVLALVAAVPAAIAVAIAHVAAGPLRPF